MLQADNYENIKKIMNAMVQIHTTIGIPKSDV